MSNGPGSAPPEPDRLATPVLPPTGVAPCPDSAPCHCGNPRWQQALSSDPARSGQAGAVRPGTVLSSQAPGTMLRCRRPGRSRSRAVAASCAGRRQSCPDAPAASVRGGLAVRRWRAREQAAESATASLLGKRVISVSAFWRLNAGRAAVQRIHNWQLHQPLQLARRGLRVAALRETGTARHARHRRTPSACPLPGAGQPTRLPHPSDRRPRQAGAARSRRARRHERRLAGRAGGGQARSLGGPDVHHTALVGSLRSGRSSSSSPGSSPVSALRLA